MAQDAESAPLPGLIRPTLAQVASLAGVSLKTASRALNGEPNVARPTRVRVSRAADKLGFRPNSIARELRRGATSTLVGLISGDLANPFYSAVASGVERELRGCGLQLVMASNDEDPERERTLIGAFLERRVSALLLMSACERHDDLALPGNHGVPFIFLDRRPLDAPGDVDAVVIDNRGGARRAGEHLLRTGHRRIAVVGDPQRYTTHRERIEGFVEAMTAAGNDCWRPYLSSAAHDLGTAERSVAELMRRDAPPTAIFTTNNRLTIGALRALAGYQPPPALVGFDDFDLGDVLGITVVAHGCEAMGRQAARLALDRAGGQTDQPRIVTMPTQLVIRGSGERAPQ
ncbi:MAG: LacI family DNA-binding transcriptional regulator [Dactylosporangium sp.]|nr:LacI family transcriptional regulator [Dactylosporangium sp.]NNJ59800.1 LacI family DNA-binding transcriptional regulator [Dactylosporangium sp.]